MFGSFCLLLLSNFKEFCEIMSWIQRLRNYFDQRVRFALTDPENFQVKWHVTTKRIRIFSLFFLAITLVSLLAATFVLKGPLAFYFSQNDVSIERLKVEEQHKRILELNEQLNAQENYLITLRKIMNGETIEDSLSTETPSEMIDPRELSSDLTDNELELSEKVKDDLRTGSAKKKEAHVLYFSSPVKGTISQQFDIKAHPGIDVVTTKDRTVLSCQSGTVLFAGYTQKDGYVLIVDHGSGYISVYKHNKTILKRTGAKVQMNDPVAIVGSTGENSTGPHLHFELWYNQRPVNPVDYIRFE
jgi:murein DD-endopeptidase MepM/ murein hydrolase activator NlpD